MILQFLTRPRRLCLLPALLVLALALPVHAQTAAAFVAQPLADIATAAETYVHSVLQEQGQIQQTTQIKAGTMDARLRLKQCELPLEAFSNNPEIRGAKLTVGVRCSGVAPWTLYVPVSIDSQTEIVVVQGPLPRGTRLTEAHLHLEQRSLQGLPPQYLASVDQVLGKELSRAVNGSTVLTAAMLQIRDLVAKGQDVVILAAGSNIQVRMAGVAMQKGQQGERIDVMNLASGRTIQAVILDGATVQVQL